MACLTTATQVTVPGPHHLHMDGDVGALSVAITHFLKKRAIRVPETLVTLWPFLGLRRLGADPSLPPRPFGVSDAVFQDQSEVREYRFIQSPVTAIGNQLSAQREWGLNGHLERLTYEIPQAAQRAKCWITTWLACRLRVVRFCFSLSGPDCGRSNDWANQVFRRPGLYGQDRDQRYLAALIPEADGGALAVAVYVIRRGTSVFMLTLNGYRYLPVRLAERNQEASSILVAASLLGKQRQLETHLKNWLPAVLKAPSTYRIYLVSPLPGSPACVLMRT